MAWKYLNFKHFKPAWKQLAIFCLFQFFFQVNIFDFDHIFIPIHLPKHWALAVNMQVYFFCPCYTVTIGWFSNPDLFSSISSQHRLLPERPLEWINWATLRTFILLLTSRFWIYLQRASHTGTQSGQLPPIAHFTRTSGNLFCSRKKRRLT